jgi:hypothetical protein
MAATLALGAALRFIGLGFGDGALNARPDEELLRSGVLISLGGDLNPHYAVWGHLFHYLYVAVSAIYLGLQVLSGRFATWTDALAAAYYAPTTFQILGRAISATAGVATLLATYRLARNTLRSRLAAACSCIILSTMFLHVRDSHFATCDILLTFNLTAALAAITGAAVGRAVRTGLWTGLALASKLLAVTGVATYLTILAWRSFGKSSQDRETAPLRSLVVFCAVAGLVALLLQPFLVLDPMETWFGMFGDLFNPERRPFQQGVNLKNASIIGRYYLPQAVGWLVGGLAVAGGCHLALRRRTPRAWTLLVFSAWSILALVSVQRIFLRYLDPLLPVASIFAGHALASFPGAIATGRFRVALCLSAAALAAAPNLWRDIWLDHRLLQPDTRTLAGRWIHQNVPPDSRILWTGFEHTPAHLTMPRLFTADAPDHALIELRASRGLPTDIDHSILRLKDEQAAPRYSLIACSISTSHLEQTTFDAFPLIDRHYDIPWLQAVEGWSKRHGWLTRANARQDLVHRHVTGVVGLSPKDLQGRSELYVVVTGLPAHPDVLATARRYYDEIQQFLPGPRAAELYQRGRYDQGDAWYLPNLRIHEVQRAGPDIHIFRRRAPTPVHQGPSREE